MRLLATADLHIGAGTQHRVDALADQEQTLDQIVDTAREHQVDGILLGGDIFHKPKPAPAELHLFDRFARNLARVADTVAIVGDVGHDQGAVNAPTALELFQSDWMRVARTPDVVDLAGVAVCALPATSTARLRAVLADRGELDYTNETAAALLVDIAGELRARVPAGQPSVLLLHHHISGASLPNGLPVENLGKPVLPVDELAALGFDCVVSGDIHRSQMLDLGRGMYCGSPMTLDFGEAGFEHGVWILTLTEPGAGGVEGPSGKTAGEAMGIPGQEVGLTAPGSVSVEFVPLQDRRFVTVEVDLVTDEAFSFLLEAEDLDETSAIVNAICEEMPLVDAVVRVSYRATEEQHRRVDQAALIRFLDDTGCVHKVYGGIRWEPVRETRARVAGVDEQLDPLAAVGAWCDANEITVDASVGLRSLTKTLLEQAA